MACAVYGHSCPHWSLGFHLVALSEAIVLNILSFILIQYMFPKTSIFGDGTTQKDFLCDSQEMCGVEKGFQTSGYNVFNDYRSFFFQNASDNVNLIQEDWFYKINFGI